LGKEFLRKLIQSIGSRLCCRCIFGRNAEEVNSALTKLG